MDETLPETVPAADVAPALPPKRPRCALTGKERPRRDLIPLETLRPALADRIRNDHPDLAPDALQFLDQLLIRPDQVIKGISDFARYPCPIVRKARRKITALERS